MMYFFGPDFNFINDLISEQFACRQCLIIPKEFLKNALNSRFLKFSYNRARVFLF